MKKIYVTIIIVFSLCLNFNKCLAQWTPVYQDMNTQFYDASFPTDNKGFVAAADTGGAMVLITIDGGTNWTKRYIPGFTFINRIVMIDSLKGYLIKGGVPVRMVKTTDAFATISYEALDTCFAVEELELLDDSTGLYLNNGGRLRKFTNYGSSFSHLIDTIGIGQNMQLISSQTGYMDTGNGLLMIVNGGASWNVVNSNLGFYCTTFSFEDSLRGYFSDGNLIYKTNDGGITFPYTHTFPNAYSFATNGNFCIAANDTGNVAYTFDGGLTWQREITGINLIAPAPYKVFVTPGGSCFIFSDFCEEIRKRLPLIAGINQLNAENDILIYPNPFTSQTTIDLKSIRDAEMIQVVDVLGRVIKTIPVEGNQVIIDRAEMQNGLYFVNVVDKKNNVIVVKVIVAN